MSSPTSDVSIDDGAISVTSGLYDTDDGIKLKVAGDTYDRIHLTPQGKVLSGDGTATPTEAGAGTLTALVYDSSATQADNVFSSWSDLLDAVNATDAEVSVVVTSAESIPSAGMPAGGWPIPGNVTFYGATRGLVSSQVVLTVPDTVTFDLTDGLLRLNSIILYSASSSSVVTLDEAGVVVANLMGDAKIVADTEAVFDVNSSSAYFILQASHGAGIFTDTTLTALGAGSIADGDHPVVKIQDAAYALVRALDPTAYISSGTIEGAGDVTIQYQFTTDGVSTTHAGVSGTITDTPELTAGKFAYDQTTASHWTLADGSTVAATLDEVGSRLNALENP